MICQTFSQNPRTREKSHHYHHHVHVIFECFLYENTKNVYTNKIQDISFQNKVFCMLKVLKRTV